MIPPLGPDGHLPLGRYPCSLDELESEFVSAPRYTSSVRRRVVFDGLLKYLDAWERATERFGTDILTAFWVGGSFASAELDPEDIDISPLIDGAELRRIDGKPGTKRVKELIGKRAKVRDDYHVEPFSVVRHPFTTVKARALTVDEHTYVESRGIFDDFWQRCRSTGAAKGPMLEVDAVPRRGYLEVDPWQ
ncbi:DUF6932 family protein [Tsukamurella hominis]|uniref:DUF6932 family protein n=1 Tax=Tsukamurella hominis TaxID=1970232 RepID=UPI0039EB00EC